MSPQAKIPMFRPFVSEAAIGKVVATLQSGWIGQGPLSARLETEIAQKTGAPYAVAVNSVAAAIRLALAVLGIGPGDEVITTPQTCTMTTHPILEQGATPVFADIQYHTGNIDPADIEHRITEHTKAIICGHYGGYPCDLEAIHELAARYQLPVIEDAQDALGATYHGAPIGGLSNLTCFSFGAVQQITAGEGGMLCLQDEERFEAARRRRWFGIDRLRRQPTVHGYYEWDITEVGYGYHLTDICAALAVSNLARLDDILERRRHIAVSYREALRTVPGVGLFEAKADRQSAYQLFTMHVECRDEFCRMMRAKGIETSIVHERNDIYTVFGGRRDDLPGLDRFSASFIAIPLYQHLRDEDVDRVVMAIRGGW